MCSNPLPPRAQKPGAVGLPAGPEVRIADETEPRLLGDDATGEVVISGPNVDSGLQRATRRPTKRTSSRPTTGGGSAPVIRGRSTPTAIYTLTGRLKEIINRGGEKVSPARGRRRAVGPPRRGPGADLRPAASRSSARRSRPRSSCARARRSPSGKSAISPRSGLPTSRCRARSYPRRDPERGDRGKPLQRIGLAEKLGLVEGAAE